MTKPFGFSGTLLRVDLTTGSIKKEPLNIDVARKFLGGKGYGAYLMFTETEGHLDPLGPLNKLVFMLGPLTGTRAPCSNKFAVCTKSPLTSTWLDSHCGGFFGPELKFAGYDGIIIEGMSSRPVYLAIQDEDVKIRDAGWLWGANTLDTERLLKEKHSDDRLARIACIGPAGERKALLANVISERRAAGRGGAGAVMGSKSLKAIVVTGHRKPEDFIHDSEKFNEAVKICYSNLMKSEATSPRSRGVKIRGRFRKNATLSIQGTGRIIAGINEAGGLPTRNFQNGMFEGWSEIEGEAFSKHLNVPPEAPGIRSCYGCPIRCGHLSIIKKGKWAGILDEGPEYENIILLGANCGVSDREAIAAAEYFSDFYGLDAMSVGGTIAFLMECYEKGLITKEYTNGLDLRFGNAEGLVEAIIAGGTDYGKLGSLVANGSRKAAEKIGRDSEKFAIHVKGLEIPAFDPRAAQGMGLCYARSDRGACHLRPFTAGDEMLSVDNADVARRTEGKAQTVKSSMDFNNVVYNSTGLCLFVAFGGMGSDEIQALITSATGFQYDDEFLRIGERITNLTRMFNIREGFSSKDDILPFRLLQEPLPSGPCKGEVVKLHPMLEEYYRLCGWDTEGIPKKEKLKELELDFAIAEVCG
jgi:aldehyde:ferredoxin oxidoreductase